MHAQLLISEGSFLSFINNTALQSGGAIFATKPALSNNFASLNRQCFLQYSSSLGVDIPPEEWKVSPQDSKEQPTGFLIAVYRVLNSSLQGS